MTTSEDCATDANTSLTPAEQTTLKVFRKYLITPGKMLCFYGTELEKLKKPLAELTSKGMLVAETFRGGYSLTESGFAAMNRCDPASP